MYTCFLSHFHHRGKKEVKQSNLPTSSSSHQNNITMADQQLFDAAKAGNLVMIEQALHKGAIINLEARTKSGDTPILLASYAGHLAFIRKLVSLGANPRHQNDSTEESALHRACDNGHIDLARYLLNCRCNPNVADKWGWTALHRVCWLGRHDLAALLLDNGAEIHCARKIDGDTPLHIATKSGSRSMIQLLLDRGARIEDRNARGRTPLHLAVGRQDVGDNVGMLQDLLDRNADLSARDEDGKTPLDLSLDMFNGPTFEQLLTSYREKLLVREGRFAAHAILHGAVFAGVVRWHRLNTEIGTLTVEHLATLLQHLDPDLFRVRNYCGMLPLHVAAGRGAPVKILERLMYHHASRVPDNFGSLPIHHACSAMSSFESIQYFVKTGGIDTVQKRDNDGCLPLHLLFRNASLHKPTLAMIKCLAGSGSLSTRTLSGDLAITLAGASSSLDTINFLIRQGPEIFNTAIA